jgi:hypothetical protein
MNHTINGAATDKRRIFLSDLPFFHSLWHSSEDTTEKSLTKGEIPLNDYFRLCNSYLPDSLRLFFRDGNRLCIGQQDLFRNRKAADRF